MLYAGGGAGAGMLQREEVIHLPKNGKKPGRDPVTGRFTAGNSCGGRKPVPEDLKEAFQLSGHEALAVLLSVMRDKRARNADRIKAAEIILDRGYGKPRQAVELDAQSNEGCGVVILPARMDDPD